MDKSNIYKAIDEADVPGLRVKMILPKGFQPLIDSNQVIKVITLDQPTLEASNFTQYQPTRIFQSRSILYYSSLDYKAQTYFAGKKWKLTLLGTTLSIKDAEPCWKSEPDLQEDRSPNTTLEALNGN